MPSLCAGWTVHDVVAHVLSYDELSPRQLAARFVRGRLLVDRVNAVGLAEYAARTPAELVELLRAHLTPRGLPAGMGGAIALTDGLVHQQDIRRPLGIGRDLPGERLRPVLDFARTAPPIGAFRRIRGLRLVATDLDWAMGKGDEVTGPGEALLMAMAGRGDAVGELAGPGLPVLAGRVTRQRVR